MTTFKTFIKPNFAPAEFKIGEDDEGSEAVPFSKSLKKIKIQLMDIVLDDVHELYETLAGRNTVKKILKSGYLWGIIWYRRAHTTTKYYVYTPENSKCSLTASSTSQRALIRLIDSTGFKVNSLASNAVKRSIVGSFIGLELKTTLPLYLTPSDDLFSTESLWDDDEEIGLGGLNQFDYHKSSDEEEDDDEEDEDDEYNDNEEKLLDKVGLELLMEVRNDDFEDSMCSIYTEELKGLNKRLVVLKTMKEKVKLLLAKAKLRMKKS